MDDQSLRWIRSRCKFVVRRTKVGSLSDEPVPTIKSLFLCMVPRSGSTFLGAVLRDNGFGNCVESFRVVEGAFERDLNACGATNYEDYIRYKIERNRDRDFFSAKVDWLQFIPLYYFGIWKKYFENCRMIYLTREDVLLQAVSRYIGTESGIFHTPQRSALGGDISKPVFDYDKIFFHLEHLIKMMSEWEHFFAVENITPLRLTYEQVRRDPGACVRQAADFCEVAIPQPPKIENEYSSVTTDLNAHFRDLFVFEHRKRRRQFTRELAAGGKRTAGRPI